MPDSNAYLQAQLHLQVYDLRREARLRQAREWFMAHYFVRSLEESNLLTPPGSDASAFVRMVVSYWDQACALLNRGLLEEELFFETSGEFYAVWERIQPVVEGVRTTYKYPPFAQNLEKAALRYEQWMAQRAPGYREVMQQYSEQLRQEAARQREKQEKPS